MMIAFAMAVMGWKRLFYFPVGLFFIETVLGKT